MLKYSKDIKGLKYIIITLLTLFWIGYATPYLLLRIPYIQQQTTRWVTSALSDRLGVPIQIEKIDIDWINRLAIENLYLEDQAHLPLLEANHVSVGFEILPLFKGKMVFSTIRLFGFSLNLKQASAGQPLNLQFVIDAFSSKKQKKDPNIDLRFNSVLIRRGNVSYDVADAPELTNRFDAKHINIHDISAKITLKALNKDTLNAQIRKMSFKEASGFSLDKLSLSLVANKDSASIHQFEIKMPKSSIRIDSAMVYAPSGKHFPESINKASFRLHIPTSEIYLNEFSAFVPTLRNFEESIDLTANVSGSLDQIDLHQLLLRYSDHMLLVGKMQLQDISKEAYLSGEISKFYLTSEGLQGLANNLMNKPTTLPQAVTNLSTIHFNGGISGYLHSLKATGLLETNIGSLQTDIYIGKEQGKSQALFINGQFKTSTLHLHKLFPKDNPYGTARLNLSLHSRQQPGGAFEGNVQAHIDEFEYKGYTYNDIELTGDFHKNSFNGILNVQDPNGTLYAEGLFQHEGENSVFKFTSRLDNFRPDSLNLTDKYKQPNISGRLRADFTGNNIDNIEGNIRLDSLAFYTEEDSFLLRQLAIDATGHSLDRHLTIRSDVLNGEVIGAYSFETIVPSFINTLKTYIPALINVTPRNQKIRENNFSLLLNIDNTEKISNTLKLPFTMIEPGRITGHYNNTYNRFRFEANLPKFNIGKSMFDNGHLTCDNPEDKAQLQLSATQYNNKGLRNYLKITLDAKDNEANAAISWANNKTRLFHANLAASAHFSEVEQEHGASHLLTEIQIKESPLVLNDSTWTITPSTISIEEGQICVNDFKITGNQGYMHIDGKVSKQPTDTLTMDLQQVELSYIFDVVNIPVLQFGGEATGRFKFIDLMGNRILQTDDLEVQNFAFNQTPLGRLNLFSEWDNEQQGILLLGSIYKNDTTWTDVNGYIFPVGVNAGLSLYFEANDINIAFLHPFVSGIVQNIKGRGFGNVHLYGPFSQIDVEGEAYVEDGGLGIEFLNTYYHFSDSIHLQSGKIIGRDVTVHDKYDNTAKLNLMVNHKYFKDVNFNLDVQANNMLVYDVSQRQNPQIFGSVYGTGTASIYGNDQLVNFDINMQSASGTNVSLDFMSNTAAADYDFITFVDKRKLQTIADTQPTDSIRPLIFQTGQTGTEMRMNFLLDITPTANIDLIMDPVAGDKISGNCTGSLQVEYGTKTDLRMYGNVGIVEGNYNFSLQQLIHKNFKIRDGSSISFRGDPFGATMNINAIYNLTANIQDLDASFVTESTRKNIPVNCVLKLDGILRNPEISFDIELPGSHEELERQVRSLVDTEDMMTRQIVYLLVLNKFYTPDYTINPYKSNDFSAVASSALSSQISSIISSFTDKVQLGTNIRASQDGFEDTELEMLLSTQLLDNRLIFNGNFGYKNSTINQKNAFIGEFDLEYLLTPGGDIRLKAYNHANDMYMYLKQQALTTQGVGILYKKDFSHLRDIFRRRKKLLNDITTAPRE